MIKFYGWFFLLSCAVLSAQSNLESLNTMPFFGVSADYSQRRGTYDLDGGMSEDVSRSDLITCGIIGGKRFNLSPWLRLQVEGVIKYGTVIDDTLPAGSQLSVDAVVKRTLFHGGIIADLQVPLDISGESSSRSRFYLHGGMGIHLARIAETELLLSDQSQTITGDPSIESPHVMVSPSIHGGLGWETRLSADLGLAVSYSLRYWDPVHYTATGDEFPLGASYNERFFSHEIDIVFLIKR